MTTDRDHFMRAGTDLDRCYSVFVLVFKERHTTGRVLFSKPKTKDDLDPQCHMATYSRSIGNSSYFGFGILPCSQDKCLELPLSITIIHSKDACLTLG